jgi:hypothetical protein
MYESFKNHMLRHPGDWWGVVIGAVIVLLFMFCVLTARSCQIQEACLDVCDHSGGTEKGKVECIKVCNE